MPRTISFDREVNLAAVTDPSTAQLQLWLAQMKRDHGDLSDLEMSRIEAGTTEAKKSKTMYNPFTGEIRKVEF